MAFTHAYAPDHRLASTAVSSPAFEWKPGTGGATALGTDAFAPANLLNQMMQVTLAGSTARAITWDAAGNMISDGALAYVHDAENRLTSVTRTTPSLAALYTYDPLGRRVVRNVNGTSTFTLHDGDEEIAEYDATGALIRRFIPGPGTDEPIAIVVPASGGGTPTRRYFHEDRIGNVIAMSGVASGGGAPALAEGPFTYDTYGRSPQASGAAATSTPFRYTGRRLDLETGNYYYRARFYTPTLGQFLETDPVGYADSLNLYAYVGGDPVNSVDPSGKCTGSRITNKDGTCAISDGWTTTGGSISSGGSGVSALRNVERQIRQISPVRKAQSYDDYLNPDTLAFQEEPNGIGHTIREHVGQTDEQLAARLMMEPHISGASTFTTYAEAEMFYQAITSSETIREFMRIAFSQGKRDFATDVVFLDYPVTGRVMMRDGSIVPAFAVRPVFLFDENGTPHLLTMFPSIPRGPAPITIMAN